MNKLQDVVRKRIRAVVVRRGLSYEEVAQRAGLRTPKTVERLLEGGPGGTFNPSTVDAVCKALGIDLADSTEDRMLPGLELWHLMGAPGWWARVSDVAAWMGASRSAFVERVKVAIKRGGIDEGDLRDGVRDGDAVVGSPDIRLTTCSSGCSMLHVRAVLYLALTSEQTRGDTVRASVIDEGLERLRMSGVRR